MATEEQDPLWSDIRQASMSAFQAQLYRERAGLGSTDALKWWERYVLSGEAATAIAAGWSLDDVVRARDLSIPFLDAIQFGERTSLAPAEVLRWWQAGVRSDEAVEALASGWSLEDAVRLHSAVARRVEHQETQRREAAARWARSEAASYRLGEELRALDEAERAQRQRRRSAVDGLNLHVDAGERAVQFGIAVSDPTYWAIEDDELKRAELGESDSLDQCLALVAERVLQIGGTIHDVTCKQIGPEEWLAASDGIAQLCDRTVSIKLEQVDHSPRTGMRSVAIDHSDDIYDEGDWDDRGDWNRHNTWLTSGTRLLVARRSTVDNTAVLMPALPEAWPEFVRHSDSVVSVGRLFLVPDVTGEGWEPVGRFDDSDAGVVAAEQLLSTGHGR